MPKLLATNYLTLATATLLTLLPVATTTSYFLSCGSSSPVELDDGRAFSPDSDLSPDRSLALSSPNAAAAHPLLLSSSARLFFRPSTYSLPISTPAGPHLLRLHFLPFLNLSSATFTVSANAAGFPLLSNFSARRPLIKEFFFFTLSSSPLLRLSFLPSSSSSSSFAFVSAIELFSVPDRSLFSPSATPVPASPDSDPSPDDLSAHVLETVHRVNVGGPSVTPRNDTLWRTWTVDDGFAEDVARARKVRFSGRIRYPVGGATRETAPESVYATAREMGSNGNTTSRNFNLTWILPVSDSGHGHLVRLHFCDIVSKALNDLYFDIYIDGYPAYMDVDLSSQSSYSLASPYYIDFRVSSSPSGGSIRVSVGPSARSLPWKSNAILNGLEIMEIRGVATFSKQQQQQQQKKKKKRSYTSRAMLELFLGCSFVVSALLIFLLTVFQWRGRTSKQVPIRCSESAAWSPLPPASSYSRLMELTAAASSSSPATNASLTLKLPFSDILLATKNFDEKSHIGSGGFGKVYRGVLRDGTAVAVKRGGCDSGSSSSTNNRGSRRRRQGATEFYAEILVLSRIRHRHLVSLVGYCEERSEMILVYEFVERGPLRDHLYGPAAAEPGLSWKRRLEICVGSARGLHYLHTGSSQGVVIHRDIKSSNILLDGSYAAKVADFGLSRSAGAHVDERSHVSTGVKGSFGYLDPEYFRTQQLTEKSDVYSFGVVLLEVLCARPAIDRSLSWEEVNLAEWGMKWQKKGLLRRIVDPALKGEVDSESLEKFGETVEKCLSKYGVDRPTMGEVLWNLEYVLQLHESAASRQVEAHEDCSNNNASLEIQQVCSTTADNYSGMATK